MSTGSIVARPTGAPPNAFAYPYGHGASYTSATARLVRESGFGGGWANLPGSVRRGTTPYELPRLHVEDWDADEFERRLSDWWLLP